VSRGAEMKRAEARSVGLVSALLLAVFLIAAIWGFLAFRQWARDSLTDPPVHSYNGTTWVGDVCHVDDVGTLWCTASG
jgi:hypothetical protein